MFLRSIPVDEVWYIDTKWLCGWLDEHDIPLEIYDEISKWNAVAQHHAWQLGLDSVAMKSVGSVISRMMTNAPQMSYTESVFREDEIVADAIRYVNGLRESVSDEVELVMKLWDYVFEIYVEKLHQYEYKDYSITFRIGESTFRRFEDVTGDSHDEKFQNLIQCGNSHH